MVSKVRHISMRKARSGSTTLVLGKDDSAFVITLSLGLTDHLRIQQEAKVSRTSTRQKRERLCIMSFWQLKYNADFH